MKLQIYEMPKASPQPDEAKTGDDWVDPLFIGPRASHARSMIILHGRGDNAYSFAKGLMSVTVPTAYHTLDEMFPDTKFIFPTAKRRPAVGVSNMKIEQWFDIYSLKDPDEHQNLQYDGLRESAMFVHDIIRQEAEAVGLENVVLGGLSQGCALGLHAVMSFEGEPGHHLGGFFGMSGWLPFAKQLEALSENKSNGPSDTGLGRQPGVDNTKETKPVENSESAGNSSEGAAARATQFVRQSIMKLTELTVENGARSVPIFLGHGELDEKVSVSLGEDAARIMGKLGWSVTWRSYSNLPHWYSRDELKDVANFVKELGGGTKTD